MAIKILAVKQNSEEWLKLREGKVTGSIADNLLTRGLDESLKANYKHFTGNFYTARGHILEDEAIELYEAIHGCVVQRPGMVVNDKYPNAACSPDGLDEQFLIEVKAFNQKKHSEIVNEKGIPFKIMAQLQFNMMICGLKWSRLVLYNPDIENPQFAYREIVVAAKPSIQKNFKIKLKN